jgi:2-methylcitrate dehydratase PrpD
MDPEHRVPSIGLTRLLGARVATSRWEELPPQAMEHSVRAFVNFMGCALGGACHEAVQRTRLALLGDGSTAQYSPTDKADAPLLALLNCMRASVHAFDDTHADAIVHPSSIVGAALVALTARLRAPVTGQSLMLAFAWGIELACRLSKCLSVPPAQADVGWSQSGVTGAVGAAAACGKVLALTSDQMTAALGIAASLSSGLRVAHGTMTMHLVPSQAASLGVQAALLARTGFTGPANALEGTHGFLSLFAAVPNPGSLTEGLGVRFELLRLTFKAYPCGAVIHSVVDACLALRHEHRLDARDVEKIELLVPRVTATLTDRRHPRNEFEAQVSVQHWAAVSLLQGAAGIAQASQTTIDNAEVRSLRERCDVVVVPELAAETATVRILRLDGIQVEQHVTHRLGSLAAPLSDAAIDRKFLQQSELTLGAAGAKAALAACRSVPRLDDVARAWPEVLTGVTPEVAP